MEDELKDSKNFFDFLLPRPLRMTVEAGIVAASFIGCVVQGTRFFGDIPMGLDDGTGTNLAVNLVSAVLFAYIFGREQRAGAERVQQRTETRERQWARGDREQVLCNWIATLVTRWLPSGNKTCSGTSVLPLSQWRVLIVAWAKNYSMWFHRAQSVRIQGGGVLRNPIAWGVLEPPPSFF